MTFFDKKRGLALSDPVDGRFRILGTNDGGRSWQIVDAEMPPALPLEFAFAASGQCITSHGGRHAWFATGGDAIARVFRSDDRGETLEGREHAGSQRPVGRDLRARVPRLAARPRSRRRLRGPDGLSRFICAERRRRQAAGASSPTRPTSTARARTGSPAARRSRSGRAAATSARTAAARGTASTAAASTPSTAPAGTAGPRASRAASRSSSVRTTTTTTTTTTTSSSSRA